MAERYTGTTATAEGALGQTYRAALGLIVPSANTCFEPDLYRIAPPDVTVHSARMLAFELEHLELMAERALEAARLLATADPDVLAFGCTTGSMLKGAGYDAVLAERIERASGVPTVTTATAVLEALRGLKVETVAVGTPYPDDLNELVLRFLTDNGVRVAHLEGLGINKVREIAKAPPSVIFELGRRIDRPEAEAVFLSCTNFRAAEVVEQLEQELGKPVVTSNQATAWAALRRAGIKDRVPGYGRLFRL